MLTHWASSFEDTPYALRNAGFEPRLERAMRALCGGEV
jgi:hypothetical protein